jgi:translocation and assembly module TamA
LLKVNADLRTCNLILLKHRVIYTLIFCLFVLANGYGQESGITLKWVLKGNLPSHIELPNAATDSLAAENLISDLIKSLWLMGHLTANVDQKILTEDDWTIHIYVGTIYKWAALDFSEIPIDVQKLLEKDKRNRISEDQIILPLELAEFMELLKLTYAERGFPLANPFLEPLELQDSGLSAKIRVDQGGIFTFDSLLINPENFIDSHFLSAFLGINKGTVYQESKLTRASSRLQRLPFAEVESETAIRFINEKAYPEFFLRPRKVNQADGILGLLPNEATPDKVLLTGQVNLHLYNLFQSGKYLGLEWQKIRPESQLLRLDVEYPNLFLSPISIGGGFYLLKEDTSFLNTESKLEFGYLFGKGEELNFFAGNKQGSILNASSIAENAFDRDIADTRYTYYGLSLHTLRLDDIFNPFRGFQAQITADVGNRRLIRNASLPGNFYEGLDDKSLSFSLNLNSAAYFPLGRTSTLAVKLDAGHIYNKNLFFNELFRLGGLRTLRGFNENFFFASTFSILGFEPRFYFEQGSYFFLFYDQAYTKYQLRMSNFDDLPFGVGGGLSFTTQAGIFSLVYGLGSSKLQTFEFSNSKIHIGYTSRF